MVVMLSACGVTCPACGHVMHPPAGGGCVLWSCGDVPCPNTQRESGCSCGTEGG